MSPGCVERLLDTIIVLFAILTFVAWVMIMSMIWIICVPQLFSLLEKGSKISTGDWVVCNAECHVVQWDGCTREIV